MKMCARAISAWVKRRLPPTKQPPAQTPPATANPNPPPPGAPPQKKEIKKVKGFLDRYVYPQGLKASIEVLKWFYPVKQDLLHSTSRKLSYAAVRRFSGLQPFHTPTVRLKPLPVPHQPQPKDKPKVQDENDEKEKGQVQEIDDQKQTTKGVQEEKASDEMGPHPQEEEVQQNDTSDTSDDDEYSSGDEPLGSDEFF